jgi:hypothetical protein
LELLCTPEGGTNPESPAQLVSHFVAKDPKKTTVGIAFDSIRHTFGWPIGISYTVVTTIRQPVGACGRRATRPHDAGTADGVPHRPASDRGLPMVG